ncbi:ABC transporter ATP-binding protein [Roseovarius arcticus]|uniref:ABC transporter ATP-binding protein n=1 Tax=Roseovarius arcticus TaxID=2547404 RepID=UPI0011104A1D|nr:ABC transporter ATP-binding protein [Roseovarius arcticus]
MLGKDITLSNASVMFGDFTAVHPLDLVIEPGEFFSILGPSGCGKTTLLRMLSGFLQPTTGNLEIGGEPMNGISPSKRPTSLIFQNLALFPLMTVWENVAFGLEMRGWSKAKRKDRALELLSTVALSEQANKTPAQLSGGQRQRVAIARALAVEPAVLLLDEPLSALDLKLRQHMRAELKQLQKATGITFVYITHDQGEALTMSDRVAVMNQGRVEQVGTSDHVYRHPENPFVATFVGENNIMRGRIVETADAFAVFEGEHGRFRAQNAHGLKANDKAMLFIRPERMVISKAGTKAENAVAVKFLSRDLEGPFSNLHVQCGKDEFSIHQTNLDDKTYDISENLTLSFSPHDAMVMAEGALSDE